MEEGGLRRSSLGRIRAESLSGYVNSDIYVDGSPMCAPRGPEAQVWRGYGISLRMRTEAMCE